MVALGRSEDNATPPLALDSTSLTEETRSWCHLALGAVKTFHVERSCGMALLVHMGSTQPMCTPMRLASACSWGSSTKGACSTKRHLHEFLVGLVDRKEVDLVGMVKNSRVPAGSPEVAGAC